MKKALKDLASLAKFIPVVVRFPAAIVIIIAFAFIPEALTNIPQ